MGYKVTLLTLTESGDEVKLAKENLSFLEKIISVPIQQNKVSQVWRLLCNLHKWLLGTPAEVLVKHSAVMQHELKKLLSDKRINSVLIGPGAGVNDITRKKTLKVLSAGRKTVLDADALTVFRKNPEELFDAIMANKSDVVLTPGRQQRRV